MIKISIKIIVDSKQLSDGNHRLYLRLIQDRKRKTISLGFKCKLENFQNGEFTKSHPGYKLENELLLKVKTKANQILRNFQLDEDEFTLDDFEEAFRGKKHQKILVSEFFDEIIEEMSKSGRTGNAKAYADTKRSIFKLADKNLKFKEITPTFLEKYEVYLRENGNENAGIAFKMRELRALYNKAIKRDLAIQDSYPFNSYKISKLKSQKNKKSLSVEEFRRIRDIDLTKHPHLLQSHHFFMFSVYTRGMNFQDIMLLKWSNIQDGRIFYTRSKTKGQFNIDINIKVQEILDYYKAQNRQSEYVFPILLKDDLTPIQIANRKHKVISRYNNRLKEIGKLAKIEKGLSSYVARHSFATLLKNTGTSIDKISEMMGHSNVEITMTYLKDFDSDVLDFENQKLLDL